MTDSQAVAPTVSPEPQEQVPLLASSSFAFFLKFLQSLCVATLVFCAIATYLLPKQQDFFILLDAALLAGLLFLLILNDQVASFAKTAQVDLKRKARLYANLLPKKADSEDYLEALTGSREKALAYCQELIDDYKSVRKSSRSFYYIFQISTIILSGVTPILVLVDKQVDVPYLKWLPVICPAIASVVTSVATSFPFQERWVNANRVVEKLEAEQEKFVLGVTQPYRAFMILKSDEERQKKLKLTIENFILEVNKIHLQQVESVASRTEEGEPVADKDD